jgi:outer membrane lipoprotein-sorting protein
MPDKEEQAMRRISLAQSGRRMKMPLVLMLFLAWFFARGNSDSGLSQQDFLEQFERKRKKVETFAADFVQKKTLPLFDEEKISTGQVLFKTPHRMIWKYTSPDKTEMKVTNESVSFYFPALEQIEVYRMEQGKGAAPFFFAFEATAGEIKENFTLAGPVGADGLQKVELHPKTDPLAAEVKSVALWLAEADYLPRKILIHEVTGDTTEITFSNVRINQLISDEELEFDAPKGTAVIEGNSSL